MKRLLDLGFRNKICNILLIIMGCIFALGTVYCNMILMYIFTISFALLIFLLVFPFNKIKQLK